MWKWHGVPIGLPALPFWRAAGLSALWSVFAFRLSHAELKAMLDLPKDKESAFVWTLRFTWLVCLLGIVGMAWVAKFLVG